MHSHPILLNLDLHRVQFRFCTSHKESKMTEADSLCAGAGAAGFAGGGGVPRDGADELQPLHGHHAQRHHELCLQGAVTISVYD